MGYLSLINKVLSDNNAYNAFGDFYVNHIPGYTYLADMLGYTQKRNSEKSTQAQKEYEEYLRGGNERALADWNKNVGVKGRTIRYPEFSYAGQIYRGNTAIARAGFDYSTAGANFYGNLPYRAAGLYGIASRFSRFM